MTAADEHPRLVLIEVNVADGADWSSELLAVGQDLGLSSFRATPDCDDPRVIDVDFYARGLERARALGAAFCEHSRLRGADGLKSRVVATPRVFGIAKS